jgi:CubicO group peptidase (beta-lactamase class C family)
MFFFTIFASALFSAERTIEWADQNPPTYFFGRCAASSEYLSGVSKLRPVFPPYFTPSYSNLGFALLGAVIEAVTGKSYDDVIADDIVRPLNLTRTSVRKPQDDSLGIIPVEANDWEWDLGAKNP